MVHARAHANLHFCSNNKNYNLNGPTRKLIIERSYDSSLDGDAVTPPLGQLVTLVTPLIKPRHWGQSHSVSLRHGQCNQLTNHILSVSATVSAINSPITFCQSPPRSVQSTHQSHSVSLRHGQCDQLTNHILSVSATVSAINSPITFCQSPPSATVNEINSPITFCESPPLS